MSSIPPNSQSVTSATRREFLTSAALAAGAAMIVAEAPGALAADQTRSGLVDVNVNLGRWPMRQLIGDDPAQLAAKLRSSGVTQAWTGSLDGLLHRDLAGVNARLAEDCRRYGRGLLLPFGVINPKSPGWEQDLAACSEVHRMRGIRLYPNYHGYRLEDPVFKDLLRLAAGRNLIVQIALVMEDERMMHPLLRVEPADPAPLAGLVAQMPRLRLVLLNALRTVPGAALRNLAFAGDVSFEISMLEGVGGIARLLEQVPATRILFGSHAPLFYLEAAALKLKESPLTPAQFRAIRHENANRLLTLRD